MLFQIKKKTNIVLFCLSVPQRRVIPAKKLGVAPIQQLQQQQQQPNVVRHEHMATAEQMGSYVAGKRKRAQST